jgi:anti-sigma regulatory factor (Ser/Thr protein kinase)
MSEEKTLRVPGRFESLAEIADFIAGVARDAGFDEDDIFRVQMAVDEACSNVVEHAYGPNRAGDILISCRVDGNGDLRVDIYDRGRPFNPDVVPEPRVGANLLDLEEMKVGGLGLFFMRKLMDEVTFHFDEGVGNHLSMVKRGAK